jgi:hypothetical protein
MLMGEPISAGLRRTDKSVLNDRGVKIDTNDDTARVYPSRTSEDGSGEVERGAVNLEPQPHRPRKTLPNWNRARPDDPRRFSLDLTLLLTITSTESDYP